MYTITKDFHFSASHQLKGLPAAHPCMRLHGHNYIVRVVLSADTLNEHGFVVDYNDLAPLKRYIDTTLDHQHLNDVLPCPTTAEHIAHHLYEWCKERWSQTLSVAVSETPKTWAMYRGDA